MASRLFGESETHLQLAAAGVDISLPGAYATLYTAMRKAFTAVLAYQGLRVRSGEASHAIVIQTVLAQTGDPASLHPAQRIRARRNAAEYPDHDEPSINRDDVERDLAIVQAMIPTLQQFLDVLPVWR